MKRLLLAVPLLLLIALAAWRFLGRAPAATTDVTVAITITQNGVAHVFTPGDHRLQLDKAAFDVSFYNKAYRPAEEEYHALQLAASYDADAFADIRAGMHKDSTGCLRSATGMAGGSDGFKSLAPMPYAHHYLYYQDRKERRVELLGEEGDLLHLGFTVDEIYLPPGHPEIGLVKRAREALRSVLRTGEDHLREGSMEIGINELDADLLRLVFFADRNQNKIIDAEELTKLTLDLNRDPG